MQVLPSASRAVATYTQEFTLPPYSKGLLLVADLTTFTATSTLDVKLQGYNPDLLVPAWFDLFSADAAPVALAIAQLTAVSRKTLQVYPGIAAGAMGAIATRAAGVATPRRLRVSAVVAVAGPDTFSVSAIPLF